MSNVLDEFGRPMLMARETDHDQTIETPVIFIRRTNSGEIVTHENALLYATVFACINVISESFSMLPWRLHKRLQPRGSEVQAGHQIDQLINVRANDEIDSFSWREFMTIAALTWGNGVSEIERNAAGRAVALWPIMPDRVTIGRDEDGQLIYSIFNSGRAPTILLPDEVFHLKGPTLNGVAGTDRIVHAAQAIGLGMAADKATGSLFANGGTPPGFLKHEGKIEKEAADELLAKFEERHGGSGNKGRTGLLTNGLDYMPVAATNQESQTDETRLAQILEVCRVFRVPPHKVGELSRATFSNITEQEAAFWRDTLMPWAVRIEKEGDFKLLRPPERRTLFTKVNANAILRGTPKERAEFYKMMQNLANFTVNDVMTLEDMPDIGPDGDERLVQLNQTTLSKLIQTPIKTTPAAPIPADQPAIAAKAIGGMIRNTAERVILREIHRTEEAAKQATDADDFSNRIGSFYDQHAQYIRDSFSPVVNALAQLHGLNGEDGETIAAVIDRFAAQQAAAAMESVTTAYRSTSLADMLASWKTERPKIMTQRITTYVRMASVDATHDFTSEVSNADHS